MPQLRASALLAVFAALLIVGCAGDSDGGKKGVVDGAGEAKVYSGPKPKKENLPFIPANAGKVDEDAPDELTPTSSGLYYRILRKSNGRRPQSDDVVVAHYRGTLDDGTEFDSSYKREEPAEFAVDKVIPGWSEGLRLVGEGGMIELEIKPSLGYGGQRQRGIPPNSRLHFIVELIKIKERP